jgi:hypothetical protein
MLAVVLFAFIPVSQPITLDNLGIDRARMLDGQRALVSLLVGKPPSTWKGSTVVGAHDRLDGVERTAILVGRRLDVEGRRIVIVGTLRVIEHPARRIGQEVVLPWVEIRVEEGK